MLGCGAACGAYGSLCVMRTGATCGSVPGTSWNSAGGTGSGILVPSTASRKIRFSYGNTTLPEMRSVPSSSSTAMYYSKFDPQGTGVLKPDQLYELRAWARGRGRALGRG